MRRLDDPFHPIGTARASGYLARGNGHRLWYEEAGSAGGVPLLLCHGGPGGSSSPGYRRCLDGSRVRVVQFDQRGCGRSEPAGCVEHNTLQHTIADIEALREHLGIACWVVAGGSWGSTVALAYAEAYPDRVLALLLVSTWLCRAREIHWWFQGVRTVFPDLWEAFAGPFDAQQRLDLRHAYATRIFGADARLAAEAATRLYLYEEGFMHFDAPFASPDAERGPAYGRIFMHYAMNDFFLRENQLVEDAVRIAAIPAVLVSGRYDMCTTPDNAYDLAACLPHAELHIVPGAGHYPSEPALGRACAEAARDLLRRIGPDWPGRTP